MIKKRTIQRSVAAAGNDHKTINHSDHKTNSHWSLATRKRRGTYTNILHYMLLNLKFCFCDNQTLRQSCRITSDVYPAFRSYIREQETR